MYISSGSSNYDYGFIKYDVAVGFLVGTFGFDTSTPKGDYLAVAGYPADLDNGQYMYIDYGNPLEIYDYTFTYNMDTFGGESGSPVFYMVGTSAYAKGIHIIGGTTYNKGRRLTTTLVNWLSENGLLEK